MERSFTVPGRPATKGSKNIGRHGQMYEQQSHRLKDWMLTVAQYAMLQRRGTVFDHDCEVMLTFRIGGRDLDSDKLERAVWDALQEGGLLLDDKFIVFNCTRKFRKMPDRDQGVDVTIRSVEP